MAGQNNDITLNASDLADNQADKPSFLKRVWSRIRSAIQADNFLGSLLRANILTVLLSIVLLVLFFAFPPISTQIMLQLGTALGAFAFWTYASSYAGAVSIVVAETYLAVLTVVMTFFGIADGAKKLVDFCKSSPDDLKLEPTEVADVISTKSLANEPSKYTKLFPEKPEMSEKTESVEPSSYAVNGV